MTRRLIMVIVVTLVLSLTYGRSAGIHGPAHAQDVNPDNYPPTTDPSTIDWAAIPAPDLGTPSTERPVLFIHGLDAWDELGDAASVDCYASWDKVSDKLHALGWDTNRNKFRYISYYYGDKNCSGHETNFTTIEHHGPWGHNRHNGGQGHEGKGHNNEAYIQHLAYHLAWYIYDHYTSHGIIVTVVAHSMGGLLINYAIAKAQQDGPDFPAELYVGQVITVGSPHWCPLRLYWRQRRYSV